MSSLLLFGNSFGAGRISPYSSSKVICREDDFRYPSLKEIRLLPGKAGSHRVEKSMSPG